MQHEHVEIAVIGGSGLASLAVDDARTLEAVPTPYGVVTGIVVGRLDERRIAFLARHGAGHRVPPHRIDARAQLWAIAALGARVLVSTNAVGGLDQDAHPGDLVLTDQLIDRTWGRADTFFDGEDPAGGVQHLPFAEPYSSSLRAIAAAALRAEGEDPRESATSVVVQGPRFSTRAEAAWHRRMGAHIVNMTQLPEAALAAELGLAHVNIAIITDTDTEHGDGEQDRSATAERVFRVMAEAGPRLNAAIAAVVAAIPAGYAEPSALPEDVVRGILCRSVVDDEARRAGPGAPGRADDNGGGAP
ncbi:MTAP family purine nucleoside phosphorylase [Microbacterium sp. CIAB417]|uniref:MTAP family purine nucleoside phosphorylase n=1 Tax=Microbacterium sp. CIAB417 TaxID=2860287 RepID=UPI001FAB98F5|nr:MTAP family purine nucleoside phosphorylase [Microbacterium sp. CIAB417]